MITCMDERIPQRQCSDDPAYARAEVAEEWHDRRIGTLPVHSLYQSYLVVPTTIELLLGGHCRRQLFAFAVPHTARRRVSDLAKSHAL